MFARIGFLLTGIVLGVAVSITALVLPHSFLRAWLLAQSQDTAALSPPPTPAAHEHGAPATASTPTATDLSLHAAQPENRLIVSPERLQSIGVRFAPVERRALDRTIRTVGRVEVDERRVAHVHLKLEGWIDRLLVNYTGERVQHGQILFTLYSPELVATQQEYLLALKGKTLLGANEFSDVATGAHSLLEVTRQRLRLWDITEDHIRDLERTGKVLKTLPIHSPITGTVINKTALAGMRVGPGDDLYTIADLSHVWIIADIYEYELPLVKIGQTANVTLSYDPQTVLQGHVAFLYPTLDPQTRTAKVRFELDNPGERLKPEMYATVELHIPLGTRLVIPTEAVLESGERQLLFIHHGGGVLEWRTVKLGVRAGEWVEVVDGLAEGEHVVTSSNFLIDSESRLKAAVGGMRGMPH
ncbi:MAG TPA: efflux RND transporter periplasmic adaptor subunit [Methylomirabilota bacterium]|jgi:Cu(I)/Ag(I) efflux system membrane fusion protein|nr:efflux RND transporter periplasmic adaptor subunit [Methylomirabilota bacterium]